MRRRIEAICDLPVRGVAVVVYAALIAFFANKAAYLEAICLYILFEFMLGIIEGIHGDEG